MPSPIDIRIPRATANDDTVILQEWHVPQGAPVKAGQIIASLETSKAVMEVEAEADGYLDILVQAGANVAVGAVIARLSPTPVASETAPLKPKAMPQPQPECESSRQGSTTVRYSKLALAMMSHHGIAAEQLPQHGLVRKQDVEAFLAQRSETTEEAPTLSSTVMEAEPPRQEIAQPPTPQAPAHAPTGFFADARKSAQTRGRSIIWLGLNYFFRNYLLGHMARRAPLGINLLIHRLRGVKLGKGVYIDPSATIETAYPENITIGNDVRITAHAVIMTHIKAPHALRDQGIMPLVMQPVVLEDHCFIGVNAVIMPGVTVGRGSVVTSGSVVLSNVPPAVMVTGNPAKIVKRLTPVQDENASAQR